jgi:DNA-binding MarR family transcriptional regulator
MLDTQTGTVLAQELASIMVQMNRVSWQQDGFKKLKRSEFFLMATLAIICGTNRDGIKVSELSRHLLVTGPAVTHILNTLENAGFVERISDPTDRRFVLVRLTGTGNEVMEQANLFFLDTLRGLVTELGEQDSRELIRLLTKAMQYFKFKE